MAVAGQFGSGATGERGTPAVGAARRIGWVAGMIALGVLVASGWAGEDNGPAGRQEPRPAKLGTTPNVHAAGPVLLCGQPSLEDLQLAKQQGIALVLTLRLPGEINWDEETAAKQAGLDFKRLAFNSPETMTDEVIDETRAILREAQRTGKPVMLHCGSANRVGAVWMTHCILDLGLSRDEAEKEAVRIGLKAEPLKKRALEYIQSRQDAPASK